MEKIHVWKWNTKNQLLLESKKFNTKVITEITELGHRENDLKKRLDSTNKQLFVLIDLIIEKLWYVKERWTIEIKTKS